jgi:DNA repair protein RadD
MLLGLRSYQHRAVSTIKERLYAGVRRLLVVSPTGSGKTVIAVFVLNEGAGKGKRMLFLAHRAELITQTSKKLQQIGIPHGIIQSGRKLDLSQRMQVASVPTLFARRAKGEIPPADIVMLDEAHHSEADTFRALLEMYPGVPILGFTATPWRSDGRGLEDSWDDLVVVATPRELIDQGFLADFRIFTYEDPELDLSALPTRDGEVDAAAFARKAVKPKIMGDVVGKYLEHAAGKRAVVFACTRQHSLALRERFEAEGVTTEHVDGTMKADVRQAVLDRLQAGTTQVVCNVNVLTEGVDVPAAEVCILARPTFSVNLYLQMIGRVLRLSPETGKSMARIHDHVGALQVHGFPDEPRDYSLSPAKMPTGSDAKDRVKRCGNCGASYSANHWTCPDCRALAPNERVPNEQPKEGVFVSEPELELRRMNAQIGIEQQKQELQRLRSTARALGHKPGWVALQFKARFGKLPDPRWLFGT